MIIIVPRISTAFLTNKPMILMNAASELLNSKISTINFVNF